MKREKVLIIAEAGVNHNGNFDMAVELIKKAAEAGADIVKFQTFKASNLVTKTAKKADYQIKENQLDDTQFEMLKKLEMPEHWHYDLIKVANEYNIEFLSTGFDIESIDFLESLSPSLYKIPSGELTNKFYLEHIASKDKPIIISTGMATMNEIKDALEVIENKGIQRDMITVLHCNTEYPTPMSDVNLMAMLSIQKEFNVEIGYSDHTLGIEVPIAAVALGASVIEKHFTLDKNLEGPDHKASLEPEELKAMVKAIRNIEKAISGSGIKSPSNSEIKNMEIARKSIFINRDIEAGIVLTKQDFSFLRPGNGISPMNIDKIIGMKSNLAISKNTMLTWEMIKN